MTGHVVRNERGGDAVVLQFPDRQPGTLQKGPRFISVNVDGLAGFDGRANHAECCAITRSRECSGVAVREDGFPVRHQGRAMAAHRHIDSDIFHAHQFRFFN